jgi:hypothetical protein
MFIGAVIFVAGCFLTLHSFRNIQRAKRYYEQTRADYSPDDVQRYYLMRLWSGIGTGSKRSLLISIALALLGIIMMIWGAVAGF